MLIITFNIQGWIRDASVYKGKRMQLEQVGGEPFDHNVGLTSVKEKQLSSKSLRSWHSAENVSQTDECSLSKDHSVSQKCLNSSNADND